MGLRCKILSGFIILALMLAIAGVWTIYELRSAGFSMQTMLGENYRSIHASEDMIEALEREDSAVLLLILGKWRKGREMLKDADSLFNKKLSFAYSNITVPGEEAILDTINARYRSYKSLLERPIVDTHRQGNIDWYFTNVHKAFLATKYSVQELTDLNNDAMYRMASQLKQRSNRAIMPGLIAIIAALIFTLMFNYFVNYYVVSPIIRINKTIKKFISKKKPYDVRIESDDEIAHLSESIGQLCEFVSGKENEK